MSNINLNLGDCLEAMKEMPDNTYDLAIVDPPYGGVKGKNIPNHSKNKSIYDGFKEKGWNVRPKEEYFVELKRVSKNQIIWGGNYFEELWLGQSNRGFIFWDKIQLSSKNHADGELAWTSFDKNAKLFKYCWSGNRYGFEGSIEGVGKPSNRIHPTEKPIKLYEWLLDNYAKEGDKILDTHLGSGSIALACHNRKFDLDAWEIDEEYYNNAVERLDTHKSQLTIFDLGG